MTTSAKSEVDAVAELEERQRERDGGGTARTEAPAPPGGVEGERGPAQLGGRRRLAPPGARVFLAAMVLVALAVAGIVTWRALEMRAHAKEATAGKAPTPW